MDLAVPAVLPQREETEMRGGYAALLHHSLAGVDHCTLPHARCGYFYDQTGTLSQKRSSSSLVGLGRGDSRGLITEIVPGFAQSP